MQGTIPSLFLSLAETRQKQRVIRSKILRTALLDSGVFWVSLFLFNGTFFVSAKTPTVPRTVWPARPPALLDVLVSHFFLGKPSPRHGLRLVRFAPPLVLCVFDDETTNSEHRDNEATVSHAVRVVTKCCLVLRMHFVSGCPFLGRGGLLN